MSNPESKVYLKRVFKAPVEKVFHALTTPSSILQWFGPKNSKTINARINLEVGGKYQFEIETENNSRFFIEGKYLEIDHPNRLVYTTEYRKLPRASDMKSIVTLKLREVATGTEIELVQELSWVPEDIKNRTESWELMFSRLDDFI